VLYIALVVAASAVAALTDLRTRRIPNLIPSVLAAAALFLHAREGWGSLAISAAVCVAVFLAGTVLFSLNFIGGGDVKLIAAAAATLGWPQSLPFLLCTIFAGALLGIGIALARGRLRATIGNLYVMAVPISAGMRPTAVSSAAGTMPYAIAIFAGAIALALVKITGSHFLRY
jgi:prepilin peptidase CpaA